MLLVLLEQRLERGVEHAPGVGLVGRRDRLGKVVQGRDVGYQCGRVIACNFLGRGVGKGINNIHLSRATADTFFFGARGKNRGEEINTQKPDQNATKTSPPLPRVHQSIALTRPTGEGNEAESGDQERRDIVLKKQEATHPGPPHHLGLARGFQEIKGKGESIFK